MKLSTISVDICIMCEMGLGMKANWLLKHVPDDFNKYCYFLWNKLRFYLERLKENWVFPLLTKIFLWNVLWFLSIISNSLLKYINNLQSMAYINQYFKYYYKILHPQKSYFTSLFMSENCCFHIFELINRL